MCWLDRRLAASETPAAMTSPSTASANQPKPARKRFLGDGLGGMPVASFRGGVEYGVGERGAGATAGALPQRDVAAPAARQLARDRQAEAGARGAAASRTPAVEALEQRVLLAGLEAAAAVEHLDGAAAHRELNLA